MINSLLSALDSFPVRTSKNDPAKLPADEGVRFTINFHDLIASSPDAALGMKPIPSPSDGTSETGKDLPLSAIPEGMSGQTLPASGHATMGSDLVQEWAPATGEQTTFRKGSRLRRTADPNTVRPNTSELGNLRGAAHPAHMRANAARLPLPASKNMAQPHPTVVRLQRSSEGIQAQSVLRAPAPLAPRGSAQQSGEAVLTRMAAAHSPSLQAIADPLPGNRHAIELHAPNAEIQTSNAGQSSSANGTNGAIPQSPSATETASPPHRQLESLIENLAEARESGRAARGDLLLRHAEFGAVALRLEHSDAELTAKLSSRDPALAAAAQAAINERTVVAASSETSTGNHRGNDQASQSGHSRDGTLSGGEGRSGNDRQQAQTGFTRDADGQAISRLSREVAATGPASERGLLA